MRLGVRILRALSPENEAQRMRLREAVACSQAHSHELTNTVVLKANDIAQTIRRSMNCSCEEDK